MMMMMTRTKAMNNLWLTVVISFVFVGLAVLGLSLLVKNYWQDPVYRIAQGKKAEMDIRFNKLSYPEIRMKYGENIDLYRILTGEDVNSLLLDDLATMEYDRFKSKHTTLPYEHNILTSNDHFLVDKIKRQMLPSNYGTIRGKYADEIRRFHLVDNQDLRDVVDTQTSQKTFQRILAEQGSGFWQLFQDDLYAPRSFKAVDVTETDKMSIK